MRFYFSGGSPIVECFLEKPRIMPSAFVDIKNGKPNSRLKAIMKLRRKAKQCASKGKKC